MKTFIVLFVIFTLVNIIIVASALYSITLKYVDIIKRMKEINKFLSTIIDKVVDDNKLIINIISTLCNTQSQNNVNLTNRLILIHDKVGETIKHLNDCKSKIEAISGSIIKKTKSSTTNKSKSDTKLKTASKSDSIEMIDTTAKN